MFLLDFVHINLKVRRDLSDTLATLHLFEILHPHYENRSILFCLSNTPVYNAMDAFGRLLQITST